MKPDANCRELLSAQVEVYMYEMKIAHCDQSRGSHSNLPYMICDFSEFVHFMAFVDKRKNKSDYKTSSTR